MANLPSGTITFLLSDVESSTMLWEQYPQEMAAALTHHDQIIEEIQLDMVYAHIGADVIGDSFTDLIDCPILHNG